VMTSRGARLQTRRNRTKQHTSAPSSAGKKRALTDVTNQVAVKHAAYPKKVISLLTVRYVIVIIMM